MPSTASGRSDRCESSADPDRPLDQLVDEVLDRIAPLQAVLGLQAATAEPVAVRRAGAEVLAAMATDRGGEVASQLEDALWSTSRGGQPPAAWFATPLGALIARSLRRGRPPGSVPARDRAPADDTNARPLRSAHRPG
jgi:hypothetical protein